MQVREGGGSQSPYIEQLLAVTKEAENAHRGLWSKVGHLWGTRYAIPSEGCRPASDGHAVLLDNECGIQNASTLLALLSAKACVPISPTAEALPSTLIC